MFLEIQICWNEFNILAEILCLILMGWVRCKQETSITVSNQRHPGHFNLLAECILILTLFERPFMSTAS